MEGFADRLLEAVERKRSHVVVGFDPVYESLPPPVRAKHEALEYADECERTTEAYRDFLFALLVHLAPLVVAVKPQLAFFEAAGFRGYRLYEELVEAAHALEILVIADGKRGDIGSTAEAYARAHLEGAAADALTINPWLGSDAVQPFVRRVREAGKGMFVLVKTSNPGSADLQDLRLAAGDTVYERVGALLQEWARGTIGERGYASVGAVVGGTHRAQLVELRRQLPGIPFLVPGYGAQGAGADDLAGAFDEQGTGAVVNSSRGILYAYGSRKNMGWAEAAVEETKNMRAALWRAAGRG